MDLETVSEKDPPPERKEDVGEPKVPPPPPLERAPLPEPEFIGPEEEVEFIPVKPKRKPRKPTRSGPKGEDAFKGEILVPALEKRENAFVEPPAVYV